jgi:Tfp pilus assembly protein PilX
MFKYKNNKLNNQKGFLLIDILLIMMFLTVILFGVVELTGSLLHRSRERVFQLQALYAAESGADTAIAELNNVSSSYSGTISPITVITANQDKATFSVNITNDANPNERIITATGNVYVPASSATASYTRVIRVVAQQSSTTTSSSLVSRNILDVQSGVKDINAVDVYVNGYINMNKNTTNLIAENINVAGKNTGASNCSIGGSGNLIKPTTFTHGGQTKTNINLAYNNCITPPGNSSNSNFNVTADTTITPISSTYIPWSQYMDNTYTSAGSCSDWTSGGSTKSIPNTTNSKRSQYPDNGGNVSTSCGTNGDISLGSNTFNISDNVHIRANLCQASACTPTFNNPTTNLVWLFVEGDINFNSVNTSVGSGPIVIVAYGSDPASLSSVCPDGGSIYLSNNGTTSAPELYLLASNGICLDKTKFGTSQGLAGISGKNIYIATNPGTPFDLGLNPTFPVSKIPVNLSWRAVLYQLVKPAV